MSGRHWVRLVAALGLLMGATSCGSTTESPMDTTAPGSTTAGVDPVSTTGGVGGGTTSTDGGASTTATTGAPVGCVSTTLSDGSLDLQVSAGNNYAFDSTVTLSVTPIAPNTPLHFDWSGLTIDITQQPIDPAGGEVLAVVFTLLDLTSDAFEAKLNANERLTGYSNGAIVYYPTTETSADIHSFRSPGSGETLPVTMIDPYLDPAVFPPEAHTYAVLIQDNTDPGHGVRMVQALQLDPMSINAEVVITNDSADLMYRTDLTAVVPVQVPLATANITADWKAAEGGMNGLGDVWEVRSVNEVMVAHYSLTPQQLTEQILVLDSIADQMYRGAVTAGSKFNLSTLIEETTGAPFVGIDGTGTWVLALNCGECANPAPWFLTILEPCP